MAGLSPKASVFGNQIGEGIAVVEAEEKDMPGATIYATVDESGVKTYNMLWVDTNGLLRIINVDDIYDPATQQVDFSSFDQDSDGTIVGTQS